MSKTVIVIGAAVGALAAVWVVKKAVEHPKIRERFGWDKSQADRVVDIESEDSFPASDAPSFTAVTSVGGAR